MTCIIFPAIPVNVLLQGNSLKDERNVRSGPAFGGSVAGRKCFKE